MRASRALFHSAAAEPKRSGGIELLMVRSLLVSLVPAASWAIALAAVAAEPTYFPLAPGARWVYRATTESETPTGLARRTLTWPMEVTDVFNRSDGAAYLMRGHPSDLAWFEDGRQPSEYTFVRIGENRFYKLPAQAFARAKDNGEPLDSIVGEAEIMFDFPLADDKWFCPDDYARQMNGRYCWFVEDQRPFNKSIRAVRGSGRLTEYTLRYVTNPDDATLRFVPGVGITHYEYRHHGTIARVIADLVDFRPSPRSLRAHFKTPSSWL
jgi:hypothetical protein